MFPETLRKVLNLYKKSFLATTSRCKKKVLKLYKLPCAGDVDGGAGPLARGGDAEHDCFSRKATKERERMAPRTDSLVRYCVPGYNEPCSERARVCQLKKERQLYPEPEMLTEVPAQPRAGAMLNTRGVRAAEGEKSQAAGGVQADIEDPKATSTAAPMLRPLFLIFLVHCF